MSTLVRVIDLTPTALFPKQADGELRQLAWLKVACLEADLSVEIRVRLKDAELPVISSTLRIGENRIDLLIPDLAEPTELEVEAQPPNHPTLVWRGEWQPARKWQVFAIKSTHYDLGYDGRLDVMQSEAADFLDIAARLCTDRDQHHEWHYYIEHLRFLRAYERERGSAALAEFLKKYVHTGAMTVLGNPSGPHFHWMDYEQLARFGYPARRELKDRYGLDVPILSVPDNPSVSWAGYQALAQAGFKYLLRLGHMGFRSPGGSYRSVGMPPIAWMTGPNGRDRILTSFHDAYGENLFLGSGGTYGAPYLDLAAEALSQRLAQVERGEARGPYPYDVLMISNYVDWETPHEAERALADWRKRFAYPQIRLDGLLDAFTRLEQVYGEQIPVLCEDTNNNSGDYSSIDPRGQGEKRQLTRLLPFAEGLHALATLQQPALAATTHEFNELYLELLEYDEHCWPTMLSVNAQNIFNTTVAKRHALQRAAARIHSSLNYSTEILTGKSLTADGSIAIWNSLGHSRTGWVEWETPLASEPIHLVDERSGHRIPVEKLGETQIGFTASVPAFGYAKYRIASGPFAAPHECRASEVDGILILENRWVRLEVRAADGEVLHLRSLSLDRELLDAESPWSFNAFVRCHAPPFSYGFSSNEIELSRIGQSQARLIESGPLTATIEITTRDESLDVQLTSRLRLFAEHDQFEVINDVKRMGFLHGTREDRYRENVFIAFPFLVPDAVFNAEYGPGVVNPARDFKHCNTDYVTVNRWIDVANAEFGITCLPREAMAVHCGQINYNHFRDHFVAESSHLYSYAWSNRMAGLIDLSPDDYHATLSFVFRAHAGDWQKSQAPELGWATAASLIALPTGNQGANESSFLSIDAPNAQISVFKRAETPGGGWVVRLVETDGQATEVTLRIPAARITRAFRCDLVELNPQPVPVDGNAVRVSLSPFDFVTLRLEMDDSILPIVQELNATLDNDSAVQLSWRVDGTAPLFHVFRSETLEELPNAAILIASVSEMQFRDTDLQPGTLYHYRVASATAANAQGEVSASVSIRTALTSGQPLAPITEAGVIALSVEALTVYWRRLRSPHVAGYRIYRSAKANFQAAPETLLTEIKADRFDFQLYADAAVRPGECWYFRIHAVNFAGNEATQSSVVSGEMPFSK